MDEAEFVRFRSLDRENYAQSIAHVHRMSVNDARQEALKLGDDILKDGVRTPGHEFLVAEDEAMGTVAGFLWCEVNREKRRAFLYFVIVEETERGKGVGRAALEALVARLGSEGMKSLGLHVFAHNASALRLYESLSFRTTGVNVQKDL